MADPLKISIVTPNRNGEEFLEQTIKSVLHQEYPNLEYIVVDGASTDSSLDIIDRYREHLSLVISEPDQGHTDAINKGFAASSGDVMGWINSDDILLPGSLTTVDQVFRLLGDIDWISGRSSMASETGTVTVNGNVRRWSWLRFLGGDYKHIQQESTFWRRSLWERAGGSLSMEYPLASDFELWTRFFAFTELHSVDALLGAFRIRPGQQSEVFAEQYDDECQRALKVMEERLPNELVDTYRPTFQNTRRLSSAKVREEEGLKCCDNPTICFDFSKLDLTFDTKGLVDSRSSEVNGMPLTEKPDGVTDISHLFQRHAGERCFVMGNGPSLNKTDLDLLEGETVFACNSAFLLFDRVNWRPKYYTCVDVRVIRDRASDITQMLNAHPDIVAFFPREISLHDGSGQKFDVREIIPPAENRYYLNEVRNSPSTAPTGMFSLNPNEKIVQPFTVAITMLQLAAYMGFNPIYLIGCDTSYVIPKNVKQEGPKIGESGLLLTSTEDDDPNHFDPRYFGKGREWHNPQVDKMIEHHQWVRASLEPLGVDVINATVGGQLEVYPRAEYNSLF